MSTSYNALLNDLSIDKEGNIGICMLGVSGGDRPFSRLNGKTKN